MIEPREEDIQKYEGSFRACLTPHGGTDFRCIAEAYAYQLALVRNLKEQLKEYIIEERKKSKHHYQTKRKEKQ